MKLRTSLYRTLFIFSIACAVISGCGHDHDGDPYVIKSDDGYDFGDLLTEPKPVDVAKGVSEAVALDAMDTAINVIEDVGFIVSYNKSASSAPAVFKASDAPPVTLRDFSLTRAGAESGEVSFEGTTIAARNASGNAVVSSNMTIHYSGYQTGDETIKGSGKARLIATSHASQFLWNLHATFKMTGDIEVNDAALRELEFTANSSGPDGIFIFINSAVIEMEDGTFYCDHNSDGRTRCLAYDGRWIDDHCSLEEERCEMNMEGHRACRELLGTTNAHCDLGCCVPYDTGRNICNGLGPSHRECNPDTEPIFTAIRYYADQEIPYHVPLRCSEDGLWMAPCIVGSDDTCPFGGICYLPDEDVWGPEFEGYGVCSCTLLRPSQ